MKFLVTEHFKIRIIKPGYIDTVIEVNRDELNQLRLEIIRQLKKENKKGGTS